MNIENLKSALVAFIDDQDNAGETVEPDECLDVAREQADHPRDEEELKAAVYRALCELLDARVIVAYGNAGYVGDTLEDDQEDQLEPWQVREDLMPSQTVQGTPARAAIFLAMAPMGEDPDA